MRILLIEDDLDLCKVIKYALVKQCYAVDVCNDGKSGLEAMCRGEHDLILLDRMLPLMEGAEVIETARQRGVATPTIIITAMGEVDDRVEGLDAGADDYLVKPLVIKELLAHIRVMERRAKAWAGDEIVSCGELQLDLTKRQLTCGKKRTSLSRREVQILELLLRNQGAALPRDYLFSQVWGGGADVDETNVDNYIRYVRVRLKSVDSPYEIKTIRFTGYCLQEMEQ